MRKDIFFPPVEGIKLAIVRTSEVDNIWEVHIINNNDHLIEGVIIVSKGYGENKQNGDKLQTSVLRHLIESIPAKGTALIEPLDGSLLHLFNEYWVSYYVGKQIYDKRFVFVPESVVETNYSFIPELNRQGVLHK
jgi:hypothetical protein